MREPANVNSEPVHNTAICTLFEGDYHFGLAAFVNSLVCAGYRGTVWVGYKGALPPWINQLEPLATQGAGYLVANQIRLVFLLLETKMHLTNYKPQFMLDLLQKQGQDCEYLWYFDPDIFLRCNWSFFLDWQRFGIALCQENITNILPENSPLRHNWMEIATAIGLEKPRALNHYLNGGMVGLPRSCSSFLHLWKRLIEQAGVLGVDLTMMMPGSREMPFHASDQDALNIAAMYSEHPLTTMGPEAMGFIQGGFTMYHTVAYKPWRGSVLLRALAGRPPSEAFRFFFRHVSTPIRAYSRWRVRGKQLACAIATFIGRFYIKR